MAFSNVLSGTDLSGGAPSNNLSGGDTPQSIFGPNLIEYWHASLGIGIVGGAVDTWTGQIRGIVLQAPAAAQRPVYAADGTNFQSKSVVQCAATGQKCLQQLTPISPIVFASGSRPWVGLFGRMRLYPGGTQALMFVVLDSPITTLLVGLESFPTPNVTSAFNASGATLNDNSTVVRALSASLDSAGVNNIKLNGVTVGTQGTGLSLAADGRILSLGANTAGNFGADLSAGGIYLCTSEPTAAQLANWVASLQRDFGPF